MDSLDFDKLDDVMKYSDPFKVVRNAQKLYGDDVLITVSSLPTKKYMIMNPHTSKWIHFGEMGMEDFTKHNDKQRRRNFKQRNRAWKHHDKYSPAYMSYYLTW